MSWQFVFNTSQCEKFLYANLLSDKAVFMFPDEAAKKAFSCGYQFFTWKEEINFIISSDGKWKPTNIKVSDLV